MRESKVKRVNRVNRAKVQHRIFSLPIFMLTMMAIFLSILFISKAMIANASEQYNVAQCYDTYKVQEGDSLWNIASEYYTVDCGSTQNYIEKIKEMNHMGVDDTIHTGEYLVIPYYNFQD